MVMSEEHQKQDDKESADIVEKSEDSSAPVKSARFAVFQNKYFIDLKKELPRYSTEHVKAYSAGTSESNPRGLFAMVCNPNYIPRTNISDHYQKLANQSLPKLIAYGRALLGNKKAVFCYIYQDDLGERLYENDEDIAKGWRSEDIIENILIPVVTSLNNLQQRDVTHGNIRATNLYKSDKQTSKIKLGECLSAPASFNQPIIYEPVERAMASPIGRGEGTILDDLYALGVILAMHVRNFDPLRGKDDDDIIAAKVVSGSYSALVSSNDRVASGISDLLRGLLSDNKKTRWSLEDVNDWLDGRRLSSKQPIKIKKAARALDFDGKKFLYARTLAFRMMNNPQDAVHLLESSELTHWIERSLGSVEIKERYNLALESAKEGGVGVGYWDRLIPRISIALDPNAPIRYRTMSFHINALGNVLADLFIGKKGLANFIDLFNNGTIYFWLSTSADMNRDVTEHIQTFEKIKGFLQKKQLVSEIERCLYFLNPSVHCLSPYVEEYFVLNPKDLIVALEQFAKNRNGNYPETIIDKHIACFLICRDARLIEPHTYDLSSGDRHKYIMANLKVFASIQKFYDVGPLPHLTSWLVHYSEPLIERFHDKDRQIKLKKDIEVEKDNGMLQNLLSILENEQKIKKDQIAFRRAILRYKEYSLEFDSIKQKLAKPKFFSERKGREWAATISAIISALIIIGFIMLHYQGTI
jgi:hypothetical protein